MLTLADEGGRGGCQMLTLASKEGWCWGAGVLGHNVRTAPLGKDQEYFGSINPFYFFKLDGVAPSQCNYTKRQNPPFQAKKIT